MPTSARSEISILFAANLNDEYLLCTSAGRPGIRRQDDRDRQLLTLIGFIVAVIMHGSKKTRLGAFHLRQSLGLMLTSIVVGVAATILAFIPFVGWLAGVAAWVGILVLWIMGLLAAINGEQKPVPVVGIHFQQWFGTAFD